MYTMFIALSCKGSTCTYVPSRTIHSETNTVVIPVSSVMLMNYTLLKSSVSQSALHLKMNIFTGVFSHTRDTGLVW